MGKSLYIAEKPSVAQEFGKALKLNLQRKNGYLESENTIVTWCVGHLVTMSYPEVYDSKYKRWSLNTLPFLPKKYKYEVIEAVKEQFQTVAGLLTREDVETIYVCTDSGREGEYIYRLVEQQAGVKNKKQKRVWIDSQTEEEILRGIKEAKDLSEYDNLSAAAYLRAKEDYLMGINFSRVLSLKYSQVVSNYLNKKFIVISVGRVMTCVLGMVVRREREIRSFIKTPFYRVISLMDFEGANIESEWKAVEGSKYFNSPLLYKENGFKEEKTAKEFVSYLEEKQPVTAKIDSIQKKKEVKNPPLLFNLAELQNECSKLFKISPDETLKIVQELYEKKLVTYPRTDARVLSTAVAKEIDKNIKGLLQYGHTARFAEEILKKGSYLGISKTRYVNDKQITDHYAIIPTGQGLGILRSLNPNASKIYETIVRRFLSIFYPAAVYQKLSIQSDIRREKFFSSIKVLVSPGFLEVQKSSFQKEKEGAEEEGENNIRLYELLSGLKKNAELPVLELSVKEGETSPPKRYNSGSIVLAMENAGQLIEDEELRAQIKGSGIGTSATRAEILKKLVNNQYLALNKKTQIITPTLLGEMIHDVVYASIRPLLNPELTASWEKGLNYVAEGEITEDTYMTKLNDFVNRRTAAVIGLNNQGILKQQFETVLKFYQ